MKKLVSLVLSVSLFLVLCSCGEVTPEVSSEEASSAVSSSLHYTTDERYEEVTKEVFESFVGKNLRNFTYTVTTADIFGKLILEESYLVNGSEHTHIYDDHGRTKKIATKVYGSVKQYYSYDEEEGNWDRVSYGYTEIHYPLESIPYTFEDVTFDESTGLYYIVRDDLYDLYEPEEIARGANEVYFGFKNNECVFFRVYYGGEFCPFSVYKFSDYNSTVIDVSPIDNIAN